MDPYKESVIDVIRRTIGRELEEDERRRGAGRRLGDGAIRIGTTLVRAMTKTRVREAANDAGFQNQPIRARLGAKSHANQTAFRALLRKLRTQAANACSSTVTRLSEVFGEVVWSVKTITSPQPLRS